MNTLPSQPLVVFRLAQLYNPTIFDTGAKIHSDWYLAVTKGASAGHIGHVRQMRKMCDDTMIWSTPFQVFFSQGVLKMSHEALEVCQASLPHEMSGKVQNLYE